MPHTRHHRRRSRRTHAHTKRHNPKSSSSSLGTFQKNITVSFMEMLMMLKLFHWKTYSYPTHKATDELYEKLNGHMDHFMEVLMGKSGVRTDLTRQKHIKLLDLSTPDQLITRIKQYKSMLVNMDKEPALSSMSNSDLFSLRDEILADCNQFLYLMSLQ